MRSVPSAKHTMKINGPIQKASALASSGVSLRRAVPSSTGSGDDQIQLSGLGARLAQSMSSQQAAKLSELAGAVSAGRYHPDANAVSESIIQHSLLAA